MSAIDEVKQKIDIVEVIGQYAALKKAGRNLTALCPFHSEKHPSFFVYPEQQSWHCFGACNTGGDVFAFIMKKEGLDFGEALRTLANRVGVTLPSRERSEERKEEKEEFFKVNEAATVYFHNLLVNSTAGAKAKSYLEKRGLTPKTIGDFQLGYAPDSWDALKDYLRENGHSEETMITAGVLVKGEDGRTYDRFRGKLMIPIRDIKGRVTGFGARVLDESLPKYVNSPQSPTFDKSGTLYGIDRAAAAIRKQDRAIIMEGYMDVIMAHQHGVSEAIASMGTAITEKQVNILKKLSRNLILSLDADAAGEEAILRTVGYENILNAEMRVIILPQGKDPDEVIREDIEEWNRLVEKAVPLIDFLFEKTTSKLDLSTARDKSGAVDRLLPIVAEINDPIRQAHYLQKLAGLVKVDMNTIKASVSRMKSASSKRTGLREGAKPVAPVKSQRPLTSSKREEYCLSLLLQYPELKSQPQDLMPEFFENSENREIFNTCQNISDILSLKEKLDPAIHEHLDAIIQSVVYKTLPYTDIERRYADGVCELKKTYLKRLAARRGETGEISTEISEQLREIDMDALKSKKRNPSYHERVRR
jgi:DNA primase